MLQRADHAEKADHRSRRLLAFLVPALVAILLLVIWALSPGTRSGKAPTAERIVPVTVATAQVQDLPVWKSGVGSVQPLETVDVKPRIDGQVTQIAYREGQDVAAGSLLAQLDPRPYRALVEQAVANKARDAAQLANVELNLARARKLNAKGFMSDQAVEALQAQQAGLKATLAGDQAQIDTARLNLGFTSIRSPILGRTGIRKVNTGAIVRAGDSSGIVTVTQMSPIGVLFSLPQTELDAIRASSDRPSVLVYAQDGSTLLAHGTLETIGNQIDPSNGQIELKAVFANADRKLWPGELVTVRILVGDRKAAIIVPASAVQVGQSGAFVYVLRPDRTVALRAVTAGITVDGSTEILRGLGAGETVVTTGQSRLDTGVKVRPRRAGPALP